jgi:hypothetical protein
MRGSGLVDLRNVYAAIFMRVRKPTQQASVKRERA